MAVTPHLISRRAALLGLAASAACKPVAAATAQSCSTPASTDGPVFSPSGPDAERWGSAEGFPVADPSLYGLPGEPRDAKYRVGIYSHFDDAYPTRRVGRAAAPWCFSYARSDISYASKGVRYSVDDYLARHAATGLLIARDETILLERYQYGRTDKDRLFSGSMVKSIVGLLIGIAVSEGAIKSVDDTAETYIPEFKGVEYGQTPIRDLLHMSSGVAFGEEVDNERDLNRLWIAMVLGFGSSAGEIGSIIGFNQRIAAPGTRFSYASIEPVVLGVVLRRATGRSLSDYLHDKIWSAIGTEADAAWLLDAQGHELAHTFFGAALRDYARLGRLLAHDGAWNGRQIIPASWMIEATTTRASDAYLAPGRTSPGAFGYGYLLWLLPGTRRQFVLLGGGGQRIFVDPPSKLVMVQTGVDPAIDQSDDVQSLWSGVVRRFGGT